MFSTALLYNINRCHFSASLPAPVPPCLLYCVTDFRVHRTLFPRICTIRVTPGLASSSPPSPTTTSSTWNSMATIKVSSVSDFSTRLLQILMRYVHCTIMYMIKMKNNYFSGEARNIWCKGNNVFCFNSLIYYSGKNYILGLQLILFYFI